MDNYVIVNGKKFRKGYTTGSCAAAASKAAVSMLVSGRVVDTVDIDTPAGVRLNLPVADSVFCEDSARCSVVKDGGDDPDMTSGLKIFAEARFRAEKGIEVKAGEGIGTVTSPGLKVKVGLPAINPVPMQMILKEVGEVLPENRGVKITLSVPGGDRVALKTYNPRLGIVGGISILGTSGIVVPMSEEAWKDSLALELSVAAARGRDRIIYTFGNYGEDFVLNKLGLSGELVIKTSNFLGFMLEKAVEHKIKEVLLVGHLGKIVKVAAGIFHTHSKVADARMEILAAYAALEGADTETVARIYGCKTTEAAAEIINARGLEGVYGRIVENASKRCTGYTFDRVKVGTVLFGGGNTVLARDRAADEIIEKLGGTHG
ncbi:MAG: cobalt-precorrin-5B (C(1))-methyltransferase CbiD [Eubacteriales bacterium]|jgi:cobalt-precorrin-5B (C1)-methyltransferase|nr:cobalt-precorrin-5B (C(1))-methyltransferase CbiD [Eubacteriales bacterium]